MEKYSIEMVYKSGQKYYTGKIIGDTFYRNFKMSKVVLWSDREFGINVEIIEYLQEKGIKYIVYIDTSKRDEAYKISLVKFDKYKLRKEFKFGKQYFVKVDAAIKLPTALRVPFVSKTIQIQEEKE